MQGSVTASLSLTTAALPILHAEPAAERTLTMLRPSIAYVHGCHADRGVLCVVGVVSSVVATVDGFAHSCAVRDVADCAVHPQVCARMARVLKARRCAR